MGILEKNSSQICRGVVAIKTVHPRRVLLELWIPSQIRDSLAEGSSTPAVSSQTPQPASHLRASCDLGAQCYLGSSGLSLVSPSKSTTAGVDALGPKTVSLDPWTGTAATPPQSPHHRLSASPPKTATQEKDLRSDQTRHPVEASHSGQDRLLGRSATGLHRSRSGLACGQLCFGRLLSFAEPHRHSHDLGRDPCGVRQRARRSASRHGSHPTSLAVSTLGH